VQCEATGERYYGRIEPRWSSIRHIESIRIDSLIESIRIDYSQLYLQGANMNGIKTYQQQERCHHFSSEVAEVYNTLREDRAENIFDCNY